MHKSYILVLGDTYGQIGVINKSINTIESSFDLKIDYVFHTGNSGLFYGSEFRHYINRNIYFDRNVLMVHGNHDSEELVNDIINNKIRIERLKLFKPGGEILHIRLCGVGVDIMAVGGSPHNSPGVDFTYSENDFEKAIQLWRNKGEPEIKFLLTHECSKGIGPIGNQFFDDPSEVGSASLKKLWELVKPDYHFSGRYHTWYESEENGLKVVAVPDAQSNLCLFEITRYNKLFTYQIHKLNSRNLHSYF